MRNICVKNVSECLQIKYNTHFQDQRTKTRCLFLCNNIILDIIDARALSKMFATYVIATIL